MSWGIAAHLASRAVDSSQSYLTKYFLEKGGEARGAGFPRFRCSDANSPQSTCWPTALPLRQKEGRGVLASPDA